MNKTKLIDVVAWGMIIFTSFKLGEACGGTRERARNNQFISKLSLQVLETSERIMGVINKDSEESEES